MNILAIDTSNQTLGVAITQNGELVGEYITYVNKNHSVRLMPAIDQLMKDTNTSPEQLDKIVVAQGPGSYTGVRIGLATAKSLAWALQIPVVGVSSLEVLAYLGIHSNYLICPFFDARRGMVYTGLYKANGETLEAIEDEVNTLFKNWLETLAERNQQVLFTSPDIESHRQTIEDIMGDLAVINQLYSLPRPSALAYIGEMKVEEDLHNLTPNYLRLAEAEAKWLEQQGKNNEQNNH